MATKQLKYQKQKTIKTETKSKWTYLFLIVILILTFVTYNNSLKNDLQTNWDDQVYVLTNPDITNFSTENVKEFFTKPYLGCYLPITMMSYAFDYHKGETGQIEPLPFHTTNLIFHLLNVILVFIFILKLTKRVEISTIVTLIFAIHPMHVESVAWVSERKDMLYSFFFLGSLICYIQYLQKNYHLKYYFFSMILFIFSLLSKPAAVPLSLIILLIDYFYSRKLFSQRVIIEKIPFFLLSLFFGILTLIIQTKAGASDIAPDYPIYDRIFLMSYAAVFYVVKMIMTWNLCAIYYWPLVTNGHLPLEYYLMPLIILGVAFAIFKSGVHRKYLTWGALFYLGSIFMTIQIVPFGKSITSDRYSYIPYIGLAFILGYFYVYYTDKNKKLKSTLNLIIIGIALFFSITTYSRNQVWTNSVILFEDVVRKNPTISHAWDFLGNTKRDNNNDYAGAMEAYTKSIELEPYSKATAVAYFDRGNIQYLSKNFKEAISDYHHAIALDSTYGKTYYNLALAIEATTPDLMEEIKNYTKALKFNYKTKEVYNNRGNTRFNIKDFQGAINDYNDAIKMDPNFANAYNNRGLSKFSLQKYQEAIKDFNTAISLNPDLAAAYFYRGNAKNNLKDKNGSCMDWQIAAGKGLAIAQNNLNIFCK